MKVDENLQKQREEYKEAKRKEQQEFEKMQQQEKARKLVRKFYYLIASVYAPRGL